MATYTIDIPDNLHHEIQERRHEIDVAGIVTEALTAAVGNPLPNSPYKGEGNGTHFFGRGHEVTDAINRMFSD